MLEDVAKHGVGGYFANDVAEVMDALAQVLTDEVARKARFEASGDAINGGEGGREGFIVAKVAHNGACGRGLGFHG